MSCVGKDSCAEASVECAAGNECETICAGNDSCKKASIGCGMGVCLLHCLHDKGCKDTELNCGEGACEVTCDTLRDAPSVSCGDACLCEANGCDAPGPGEEDDDDHDD